jgi:DNA-binding CsgD family transcriptional regulator
MPMLSEEHDQKALAGFPDLLPPGLSDGTPIWNRLIELEVATLEMAYGPGDIERYYQSNYYGDYAAANGARETLAASFAVTGFGPAGAASLHFWNDQHPNPPGFCERDVAILRLLFPAFQAGVNAHLRLGGIRKRFYALIDRLDTAVMVTDVAGKSLHESPALSRLIADDSHGADLRRRLTDLALRAATDPEARAMVITTGAHRYRATVADHVEADGRGTPVRLISVDRLTARRRTAAELREEFGLTPSECRAVALLALGKSNAQLAAEMGISEFTARRHTERVLSKLGVKSRAEVAARLGR